MGRKQVWGALAALGVLSGFVGPLASSGPGYAAPGDTGRITLTVPTRMVDTRVGSPIAAGVDTPLPNGLLSVAAKPRVASSGEADVFPCGGRPDAEPTFRLDDAFVARTIVAPANASMCLRSSVAVDLLVDVFGSVAGVPFAGGLQYEPLNVPSRIVATEFDDPGYAGVTRVLPRGPVPNTASAATYALEVGSDGPVSVTVHDCNQPVSLGGFPFTPTTNSRSGVGIANVPLTPGQQPCMTAYGSGYVEISLLGTLNTTGPDATRLPPTTTSRQVDLPPPGFVPIPPERAFDTRTDGTGLLQPTKVLAVDLSDYLTPFSTAVTMNVTATGAQDAGFLTVWPCDEDQPNASNLNFERGVDVPNLVTVRLSSAGTVCVAGSAATHVLGDIAGTYEFGDGVGSTPMTPTRILDTRRSFGGTIIPANGILTLQVTGTPGVPPSGVQAVTMNVTATGSQGDGYMTVWPCDQPQPNASNLNFRRGIDVPNLVTVKLSATGTVCFFSTATTHVLADAGMWFSAASTGGFVDVTPARVLDTRVPIGLPTRAPVPARGSISVAVAGHAGVPQTGAVSVTMNVTVANPSSSGYLTVWPCGEPQPDASNLNFVAGVDVPNLVSVKLPPNGNVCLFSTASTDVLADVAGYTTDLPIAVWGVVIV